MNNIINPAFREGIVRALAACDERDLSADAKERIIKDVEENWWFCGGRDTEPDSDAQCPYDTIEWERLWVYYHGSRDMPITSTECVCLQDGLRYNLFITDGKRVITIGSQCMYQFLPRIAGQVKQKHCSRCMKAHKNRKDNYCNECRILNIQEEHESVIRKVQQAEQEQRERDEEIRRRVVKLQEEEKDRQARVCGCGGWKRPEFPRCWDCREKYVASLSDVQKKALLCACGKTKKPSFTKCYGCFKG